MLSWQPTTINNWKHINHFSLCDIEYSFQWTRGELDNSNQTIHHPPNPKTADQNKLPTHHSPSTTHQTPLKTDDRPTVYICPLCVEGIHDVRHLFSCRKKPESLKPISLWTMPKRRLLFWSWKRILHIMLHETLKKPPRPPPKTHQLRLTNLYSPHATHQFQRTIHQLQSTTH